MNRYKFTQDQWPSAIAFLKNGEETVDTPNWCIKFKDDLTVKRKQIFYKNKKIIPAEKVDAFLRKEIYSKSATTPFGRDSAHYKLKKEIIGIPRRKIMSFLRAQKSLGQVRAAVAQPKVKSGPKVKGYVLECDLVFVKRNDVSKMNSRIGNSLEKELSYIAVTVEKTTGLCQATFIKPPKGFKSEQDMKLKGAKIVTPIIKKHIDYFAKVLKVPKSSFEMAMDAGGEFDRKALAKIVKSVKVVSMGASCEKKNQTIQRNMFRILKNRQADNISDAVEKSQNMCNNTFNKNQKQTPLESAEKGIVANVKNYNQTRKTYVQGDKRNELKIGDHVRILIKKAKADIGYKSYKDQTYSAEVYTITTKTKKKPTKYRVNKKYYTIDKLLKSAPRDKESQKLIKDRKDEEEKKEVEFEDVRVAEVVKAEEKQKVEVAVGSRRSTRSQRGDREIQAMIAKRQRAKRKKQFGPDADSD